MGFDALLDFPHPNGREFLAASEVKIFVIAIGAATQPQAGSALEHQMLEQPIIIKRL